MRFSRRYRCAGNRRGATDSCRRCSPAKQNSFLAVAPSSCAPRHHLRPSRWEDCRREGTMGNCGCRYSLPVVTADSHGQEIRKAASSSSSGEVSWKKSQRGGEKSLRKLISCAKLRPVQQATATSTATAPATAQATAATRSAGPRATVAASPCRDTAAPPSAPASEDPPTHGGSNDLHLNVNDKNSVRDLGRQDITPPLTGMSTAAPKDKNRNGSSGDPGDIDDSINSKDDEFVGLSLPSELLQSVILPFLDSGCLGQAGLTCSQWRESALNERLWKTLCLKEWVGKHVGETVKHTLSIFKSPW